LEIALHRSSSIHGHLLRILHLRQEL
jgi:hypothetical protein